MAKRVLDKFKIRKGKVFEAPLENAFGRLVTPFEEFIHRQSSSGILLMLSAVAALLIANSPLQHAYEHILHMPLSLNIGDWTFSLTVHHWINDGLMAIFFFLVGLELKREFLVGELSDLKQAVLPVLAAVGGMLVPALIYAGLNSGTEAEPGWGIPMATDIAFAVGCIALLGNRVPRSVVMFLVALAIVDDLGAILVIAIWYTEDVKMTALMTAGALVLIMWLFKAAGVRRSPAYVFVGMLLWYELHEAGVHATLAGVITALALPARPKYDPVAFSSFVKDIIRSFDRCFRPGDNIIANDALRARVMALGNGVNLAQSPLQRMETRLHIPVAFLVIPIFALANAGIPFDSFTSSEAVFNPLTMGVIAGLVVGKLVGITGATWLGWKLGLGRLPRGASFHHIVGVALLGGIGFTMSIFISELAFAGQSELLVQAKAGVLLASVIAGVLGFLVLSRAPVSEEAEMVEAVSEARDVKAAAEKAAGEPVRRDADGS
ncbi:Na+/H+ antiporter NhaA [Microbulbifer thermotolerans]|uniref:Na(+)/H(+) antiporter NhaA n=1 Tax=Microbulbifer thermotolerans TaxID=252514 RepID=A0AB35HZ03_MICTH|nr:Na+/H+ antiporter NhaA [Microbulbifer thermotolerans]MCX2794739.1 Na+/H+ antiporter NhaA [Microbulbifer thermotolerans]MCX2802782.1 Na+/H+ antiporter NhaA [Microbulbifer thermotolerans]MCX2834570.1 Na+/H+ antiporter NhaA [Microbulbifer thermotolerans]MCX2841771.1 Na+/H+ antiporter NhaA [Microbulbifer thermotolerans]WKT59489.1 Na+/H+ antiporter NhaA [Microbulbifer thermotolerans]